MRHNDLLIYFFILSLSSITPVFFLYFLHKQARREVLAGEILVLRLFCAEIYRCIDDDG